MNSPDITVIRNTVCVFISGALIIIIFINLFYHYSLNSMRHTTKIRIAKNRLINNVDKLICGPGVITKFIIKF